MEGVEARVFDLDLSQEDALIRQIAGLLAEASHAHWDKEQLATAIHPFVVGFAQNHAGTPSRKRIHNADGTREAGLLPEH